MSPYSLRKLGRPLHLAAAIVLGWSVYGPAPVVTTIAAYVAFPLLALSGLAMWFAPRIVRLLDRT